MALWGQLLRRGGVVRDGAGHALIEAAQRATTVQALAQCFPLQALSLDAPVTAFDTA